ncbi:type II toxin-antitoxin system TacA family antitoxin [Castellaniella sp. WN]
MPARAISTSVPAPKSSRLGLRTTSEQEAVLRRAANVAHKSLTEFILDAATRAAEQTLLDQRLFMVSGSQYQALLELLDRPEQHNPGLADLFARKAPWEA